jgi:hypothetical protein
MDADLEVLADRLRGASLRSIRRRRGLTHREVEQAIERASEYQQSTLIALLASGIETGEAWPILRVDLDEWPVWQPAVSFFSRCLSQVLVHDRPLRLVVGRTDTGCVTFTITEQDWLDAPLVEAG